MVVDVDACGAVAAFIDWPAALEALGTERPPCSSGERCVLLLAASLAEGAPVDLREALCGLDHSTLALVAGCVAHAGGWRGAVLAAGASR